MSRLHRRIFAVWGVGLMLVWIGPIARGQGRPASGAAGAETSPAPMGAYSGDEYRPSSYPETYNGTFYPAAEVQAVPDARARAVVARAELRRAETILNYAVEDMRRVFLRSTDFVQASAEEKAAYESLLNARRQAIRSLESDPSYQAAISLRKEMATRIDDRRGSKNVALEELIALATVKLSYSTTATAMEAAAVSADPEVQAARQRLVAVGARLSSLRQQFADSVRNSEQIVSARRAVEDARIARLAAEAFLESAIDARNIAMDYAYYLHRYDQYRYLSYGYYGGYPYNGGYPYYGGYTYTTIGLGYPSRWWPYRKGH